MTRRRRSKRLTLNSAHHETVERLAMAMTWQALPSQDRDYARNRARALIDSLEYVVPSGGES